MEGGEKGGGRGGKGGGRKIGFRVGVELEFFLLPLSSSSSSSSPPTTFDSSLFAHPTTLDHLERIEGGEEGGWIGELERGLEKMGVELEMIHAESGPGELGKEGREDFICFNSHFLAKF